MWPFTDQKPTPGSELVFIADETQVFSTGGSSGLLARAHSQFEAGQMDDAISREVRMLLPRILRTRSDPGPIWFMNTFVGENVPGTEYAVTTLPSADLPLARWQFAAYGDDTIRGIRFGVAHLPEFGPVWAEIQGKVRVDIGDREFGDVVMSILRRRGVVEAHPLLSPWNCLPQTYDAWRRAP